jgi:hypothetical protein
MSSSFGSRRYELECLRLASDCMQLACDVPNPALNSHFVRMAKVWQDLAERGSDAVDLTGANQGGELNDLNRLACEPYESHPLASEPATVADREA